MRFVISLIILLPFFTSAQVLDNRNGAAFTDRPFFNESFIKENKLKRLSGYYVYKKKDQMMKNTKFKYVYDFDREGHLVSTHETRPDDGTRDTTWNIYEYDNANHLITHRKTDQDGFTSIHYKYDSLDRVISEEYKRDIDSGNREILRSLTFNKERIEHVVYDHQRKSTRFNNYNLPYLDEYYNYNELGYLVEHLERIKMTGTLYTDTYEYDRNGKLSAIRKSSNQEDGYFEELLFEYDDLGNLIQKHIYKKGVFTTDIQIIYNTKSKLLATVITRQVSTGFMMILRFNDYQFYD